MGGATTARSTFDHSFEPEAVSVFVFNNRQSASDTNLRYLCSVPFAR
jgi:hypothetical protein